jgi:hypothetical protein
MFLSLPTSQYNARFLIVEYQFTLDICVLITLKEPLVANDIDTLMIIKF